MPCDYSRYPANWREIRSRILKRAGNGCECRGECGDTHPGQFLFCGHIYEMDRCFAPNGVLIVRHESQLALWRSAGTVASHEFGKPVKVVLTLAHLDHDPSSDDETRIRAFCQRCHLNYDAKQHAESARATRMARKAVGSLRGVL